MVFPFFGALEGDGEDFLFLGDSSSFFSVFVFEEGVFLAMMLIINQNLSKKIIAQRKAVDQKESSKKIQRSHARMCGCIAN